MIGLESLKSSYFKKWQAHMKLCCRDNQQSKKETLILIVFSKS